MKWFIYILILFLAALTVYNITQVNFNDPFSDDSTIALITVLAGCCGILILSILLTSRKIAKSLKKNS